MLPDKHGVEDKEESLAAFKTVIAVLKDPRCINCHPVGDIPRQGSEHILHPYNVTRKTDCRMCHGDKNLPSGIPGDKNWAIAPKSMGWYGLSDREIGQRVLDKNRNGGKTKEDLIHHMTEDSLVLWGWQPGGKREPVQVPFAEFEKAVRTWLENGAYLPEE